MKKFSSVVIVCISLVYGSEIPDNINKILNDNSCMSCHNIATPYKAPPFAKIARRNLKWYGDNAQERITDSIKNGSIGKYPPFGNTTMPSFPYLNRQQLDNLSKWILSLNSYGYNKRGNCYRGRGGYNYEH